jgi:hypothetical protein
VKLFRLSVENNGTFRFIVLDGFNDLSAMFRTISDFTGAKYK